MCPHTYGRLAADAGRQQLGRTPGLPAFSSRGTEVCLGILDQVIIALRKERDAMQMTGIPFGLTDWAAVERTEHGCSLQG